MSDPTLKIRKNVRQLYVGQHGDPDAVPMLVEKWCDELNATIATLTAERDGVRDAVEKYAQAVRHDATYGSTSSLLQLDAARQDMLALAAQLRAQDDAILDNKEDNNNG